MDVLPMLDMSSANIGYRHIGHLRRWKGETMFPTIKELTECIHDTARQLKGWGIDETDIRLQVVDGGWYYHTGDSQYDQDHKGYWGCSGVSSTSTKEECRSIARSLIEQAKDSRAEGVEL
jgi:hypothetical protein